MRITDLVAGAGMIFILIWIVAMPFAAIWAINTLFDFEITYSFWNWLAAIVVCTIVHRTSKGK